MNPACGQLLPVPSRRTNQPKPAPAKAVETAPVEPTTATPEQASPEEAAEARPAEPATARVATLTTAKLARRAKAAPTEAVEAAPKAGPAVPVPADAGEPESTVPTRPLATEPVRAALEVPARAKAAKPAPAEAKAAPVERVAAATPVEPAPPTAETAGPPRAPKVHGAVTSVLNTRRLLLGAAALLVLIAIGVAFTRGVAAPDASEKSPSDLPSPSQVAERAPEITKIQDERVAVTLTFTDHSDGAAAFYVVGGPSGRQPTTLAEAPRASTTVRVNAVNPEVDYCFVVVAVLSVDEVAPSVQVCTSRFGTAKP